MPLRALLALALLLAVAQARAECSKSGLVERLSQQLHAGAIVDTGLSSCKEWPADPKRTIVVLAVETGRPEEGVVEYDMYLLLLDSATQEILASLSKPKAWSSDAIRLRSVRIDTARYQISKSTRAFGIRSETASDSRPNPYSNEMLSLFVVDGKRIVPVLEDVEVASFQGEGDGVCRGEFERHTTTVSVSPSKQAYADLVLRERIDYLTNPKDPEGCAEPSRTSTTSSVLSFRNGSYQP